MAINTSKFKFLIVSRPAGATLYSTFQRERGRNYESMLSASNNAKAFAEADPSKEFGVAELKKIFVHTVPVPVPTVEEVNA